MNVVAVAAVVVAVAVVVLVFFLLPAILELRRTLETVRRFVATTEEKLEPALTEMYAVLADLRVVADATASKADEVKSVMTALGDTGENIHRINGMISGAMAVLHKPANLLTGVKASGSYLLERIRKKGG